MNWGTTMRLNLARFATVFTIAAGVLFAGSIFSATIPLDPNTFLTMLERYVPEDATTEAAYYAAVDPDNKKTNYADWLFETGFIDDPLDYQSTGSFVSHADATVTHQNVADLGFIRVVSTRCVPSCDAPDPDIYSVIENYPSFDDAAARTNRLASVTMEWTAAADGSNPSKKFIVRFMPLREMTSATRRRGSRSNPISTVVVKRRYRGCATPVMAAHRKASTTAARIATTETRQVFSSRWISTILPSIRTQRARSWLGRRKKPNTRR